MPGTPSTKWSLPTRAGSDAINQTDEYTVLLTNALDPLLAPSDQGLFASRPVSTVGSPGKIGRTYMATDVGALFRDNGTGWDTVLTGVGHAALLGLTADGVVRRGKSIVAATESRTNAAYGLMPTPDRVQNIVLPTDGLIAVLCQATWQESVVAAANAAIFLGATQTKAFDATVGGAPSSLGAAHGAGVANTDKPLMTWPGGLIGSSVGNQNTAYTGDVTTGQMVGQFTNLGSTSPFNIVGTGGPCYIFAAAGTYDVSVQFKASSGSVTVKSRKLWVWSIGF